MLIDNFGVFVNFTGVNSRFLSASHVCKHRSWCENCRFRIEFVHLKTQTGCCSQSGIRHWQNTIFGFLDAQLDFLAIFSIDVDNRSIF